jgi:hypothetical protein
LYGLSHWPRVADEILKVYPTSTQYPKRPWKWAFRLN